MLDGFQYLEERDANDLITHDGVASKKSAFQRQITPESMTSSPEICDCSPKLRHRLLIIPMPRQSWRR